MKRVGVIGGGQLAWMMGDAAKKLGVELIVQTPNPTDPAVSIANDTVFAAVDDANATEKLAQRCDVITFENEFVDLEKLFLLSRQGVCFRPNLLALKPVLDKYHQRDFFQERGLPTPQFLALEIEKKPYQIKDIEDNIGFPLVMKSRRHGYDGQGTFIINNIDEFKSKLNFFPTQSNNFLLEEFIPFTKELAIIAARNINGDIVTYPVVETQQKQQVCRRVFAPAELDFSVLTKVNQIATTLLESLDYVGVLAIELFLTQNNQVLINEMAPRTHNSGHLSLDACETSQFEQHLRAICGFPLGNTKLTYPCATMVNLLGYEQSKNQYLEKRQQIEQLAKTHLYWYGKNKSRLGRKMAHATTLLDINDRSKAMAIANQIEAIWYPS
ncbi:MAG: 5-(carboxyamino)imidazole ribonucleotide synthase [Richelia sp.]|nr:5-(carboxyamino)imidazole ribonucleotide synthase [Richelia sp.]CDN12342.1 Phosphoribosylaminoimidazole carboxylase ATPase subunit [Richelia intracellularis]